MGLFDWLLGDREAESATQRLDAAYRLFPEVEEAEDYEAFVRALGELTGEPLRARCYGEDRAVVVELRCGDKSFLHTQEGFWADLEALLPVVNGWLPSEEARRLVAIEEDGFGAELGVAFVDDEQIEALRADGWRVLTRDRPREGGLEVDGFRLEGRLTFHDDGAPRTGTLAEDAEIDGIPCAGGAAVELDNVRLGQRGPLGTLLAATLGRPVEVGGVTLPEGTRVQLYEEVATIASAELARAVTVAGLELPPGTTLEHDEDGRLYMATLGAPTEIGLEGPYRRRTLPAGTALGFRDGRWDQEDIDVPPAPAPNTGSTSETRTLTRDETIGDHELEAGTAITTYEGALATVELPRDAVLAGVPCAAGVVTFSLGELASAVLSETIVRDGLTCRGGTVILLWSDGALSEVTLAEPAMVAGFELPAGSRVGFYEEIGNPAVIIVPCAVELGGRACIPGQVLELDEDGRIERIGHVADARHRLTYAVYNDGAPYIDCA